jgi:hypothetical protein
MYNSDNEFKKKDNFEEKIKTYIFANRQYCWQHYVTYPYCQPVFPISAAIGGTLKLLKFIACYTSRKFWELLV